MRIETGQVAVVTGGTSGIGFALAVALMQRGVNVMIADIRAVFRPFLNTASASGLMPLPSLAPYNATCTRSWG
jgi:short-subunit dehydrogenase